jgi:mannitol-1-phosphate 5-dehydrogenase
LAFDGERRLVGLGFGAIQAGLFAYQAQASGSYASPLVVDVRPEWIAGLRADGGHIRINVARADGIDVVDIGPMQVADSSVAGERDRIVEAIAAADELATALPSVAFYRSDAANSPHRLLAEGLRRRTGDLPLIVFCAENHRDAAALLQASVLDALPPRELDAAVEKVRFVDTVIGKMSGVVTDPEVVRASSLATVTSMSGSAFLVEAFDRIIVSRVDRDLDIHPGMNVLREVDDLAPFEDAKLLGHNATHALGAFLGSLLGCSRFAELVDIPGAMGFLRHAFTEESGRTLIARYAGVDPLFTEQGYAVFADDLLARMVNPYLADTIERAARDPRRKLGWDDRLVGLIRLGLTHAVPTPRYAMGVAAGLEVLRRDGAPGSDEELIADIWPRDADAAEVDLVSAAVGEGRRWLQRWQRIGFDGLARGA